MLIPLLHKIASHPGIFDVIQDFVGAGVVAERLTRQCSLCSPGEYVLDLAGGTGAARRYLPSHCRYVCLDIDQLKLDGYRTKFPRGTAILGDCTAVPLRDSSVDTVLCIAMAHHLSDVQLVVLWSEARRVLRPDGRLIFLDPVYAAARPAGRLLWRLDRGANPRTSATLLRNLEAFFQLEHVEQFAVYHEYLLACGRPRASH